MDPVCRADRPLKAQGRRLGNGTLLRSALRSPAAAPYLASRYDTVSGAPIPLQARIGLLDRKLRVVNENAKDDADWLHHSIRAAR